MQPISFAQVNRRHPRSTPPLIAPIISLDLLPPVVARFLRAVPAEASVDQEVAELGRWLKVRRAARCAPLLDAGSARGVAVPAAELVGPLGLAVH